MLCQSSLAFLLQQTPQLPCQQVKAHLTHTGNTRPQHPAQVCHNGIVVAHTILVGKSLEKPAPFAGDLQALLTAPLLQQGIVLSWQRSTETISATGMLCGTLAS